jgi:hypothetical protein
MAGEPLSSLGVEKPVLHLIPGVSGCGKTTAGRYLVEQFNSSGVVVARLVVPHTTRPRREHELDGVDYYFHTVEDFEANYRGKCEAAEDEWVASKIGNHHYFNTNKATRPTADRPLSVLPVAFSAIDEVVKEHTNADYNLQVLPIIISSAIKQQWLSVAQAQRPNRDLERELQEQEAFLGRYEGETFYPQWEGAHDLERYYARTCAIMAGARMMINATMETARE